MTAAAKLQQVLTWILEGQSEHAIRETIAETWPDEAASPLILAAIDQLNSGSNRTHAEVKNWCIEATKFLYQRQVEIGDFTGAMRAVKQINDLSADRATTTPEPRRVEHHHTHEITVENFEEHRRRIAARIVGIGQDAGGTGGGRKARQRTAVAKPKNKKGNRPIDTIEPCGGRGPVFTESANREGVEV